MKTEPSQHSVARLREIGLQPDVLICRTEKPMNEEMRRKLSLFCNVPRRAVIEERDVETSIYEVPVMLHEHDLDQIVVEHLGLKAGEIDLVDWRAMVERIRGITDEVTIAVCGKYIALNDSYKSIYEALDHAGIANGVRVRIRKVDAEAVERDGAARHLDGAQGLLVPGGFGERGIEGMIEAITHAREGGIPFFGICLGLQSMVIEFARNVAGIADANSTEFTTDCPSAVIDLMAEQQGVDRKGGTMRLGAYPCHLVEGTLAGDLYQQRMVRERHRHRWEVNNHFRERLGAAGLVFSGMYEEKDLVEIAEYPAHPWFLGVQFHPEFKSKPLKAHPLFSGFVEAALAHERSGDSGRIAVQEA
jgi:CTP synthase